MPLQLKPFVFSVIAVFALEVSGCSTNTPAITTTTNDSIFTASTDKIKGRTLTDIEAQFGKPDAYGYDHYPIFDHIVPDSFYTIKRSDYISHADESKSVIVRVTYSEKGKDLLASNIITISR